jgi:hypothetical protein
MYIVVNIPNEQFQLKIGVETQMAGSMRNQNEYSIGPTSEGNFVRRIKCKSK